MTRKDFQAMAEMIAHLRDAGYDTKTLDRVTQELGDIASASNQRFDRYRFARVAKMGE